MVFLAGMKWNEGELLIGMHGDAQLSSLVNGIRMYPLPGSGNEIWGNGIRSADVN
jgi:hypothetical protein